MQKHCNYGLFLKSGPLAHMLRKESLTVPHRCQALRTHRGLERAPSFFQWADFPLTSCMDWRCWELAGQARDIFLGFSLGQLMKQNMKDNSRLKQGFSDFFYMPGPQILSVYSLPAFWVLGKLYSQQGKQGKFDWNSVSRFGTYWSSMF